MTFDVRYDPAKQCLVGKAPGEIDCESARGYARAVVGASLKHECKKFLNDLRGSDVRLGTIDIYEVWKLFEGLGIDGTWKRAILASEQLKDYRFFENVSVNRGHQVRVFTDPSAALAWLQATD